MRAVLFLPLAYIADVQGFLMFVPYLGLFLGLAFLVHRRRRKAVAVRV
jgi:hypothetical protein